MALGIAWVVAVALVSLAYRIAGPVWIERHSLRYRVGQKTERTSGAVGEIVLVTGGALLLWGIDLASPDVSLVGMFAKRPFILFGLFVFILPWIWVHGVRTALAARLEDRRRLVFTYLVYGVYSTIFFFGGMVMIALMVEQFLAHADFARTTGGQLLDSLRGPFPEAGAAERALEFSYLDAQKLLSMVEVSMAPTFVFAAGIFAINMAIRYTALRSLFMKNAMLMTHVFTLIAILSVLLVGGLIYVGFYSRFIDDYLLALEAMRAEIFAAPGLAGRYADIYVDITDQKSLLGFVTRMSNEWGGVAFVLGIAQWSAQQFARKEAEESPADLAPPASTHMAPQAAE